MRDGSLSGFSIYVRWIHNNHNLHNDNCGGGEEFCVIFVIFDDELIKITVLFLRHGRFWVAAMLYSAIIYEGFTFSTVNSWILTRQITVFIWGKWKAIPLSNFRKVWPFLLSFMIMAQMKPIFIIFSSENGLQPTTGLSHCRRFGRSRINQQCNHIFQYNINIFFQWNFTLFAFNIRSIYYEIRLTNANRQIPTKISQQKKYRKNKIK